MTNPHSAAEAAHPFQASFTQNRAFLFQLAFQTLGIIYSDIGTSPLYTLNGLWPNNGPVPPNEDVIGGISAIIWALTILPLFKYVFIALHFATTEGEGGTFALFQGLYPPERYRINNDDEQSSSEDGKEDLQEKPPSFPDYDFPKSTSTAPQKFRVPTLIWCLFGTSLTIADGIFTPAVSVTSAVGGIAVAKPSVANDVIPISIVLLLVLFLAQFRGTSQLGFMFAPIAAIWFILLAATGIVNIVQYPGILRAFDPSRAILYFVRTKDYGVLSGVLLALTGCEAMFASLGHFNMLSIQISFSFIVYPSVVLAYLGQGARLITDGESALVNLFYATIPGPVSGGLYWVMFVLAILATFIASQTLITAAFSLVQQLIEMHVLPPFRIVHTSDRVHGQIYIPVVNWTLMIVTIIVVATFKSSTALSNAYGFSVATVMFSTTILIAVQMKYVKHLHVIVSLSFFLVFGFFDGLFWGAALKKIPEGAYVPLIIGIIMMIIMIFWSWAKGLEDSFDSLNREDIHRLILRQEDAPLAEETLTEITYQASQESATKERYFVRDLATDGYVEKTQSLLQLSRLPTCAVFHRLNSGHGVPHSFAAFIRQWPALPRVVMFLSVDIASIAYVPEVDRFSVYRLPSVKGFYMVTYRLGYRQRFDSKMDTVIDMICALEAREDPSGSEARIQEIRSVSSRVTHIVPHYVVVSKWKHSGRFMALVDRCRRFLVEDLYRRLSTMFPETSNWNADSDEIIHVGVTARI